MKTCSFVSLCLSGFAALAQAAQGTVTAVEARNFKSTLNEHDASLVEFYAPWCGHCKALEPKFDAAAQLLESEHSDLNVALFKADATAQQALTSKYGIQSYPTIKLFYGSQEVEKYEGERETAALVDYLVGKVNSATSEEIEAGKKSKSKKKKSKKQASNQRNTASKDAGTNAGKKNKKNTKKNANGKNKNKKNNKKQVAARQLQDSNDSDGKSKEEKAEMWREKIGRSTWHLLHSVAAKYPDDPSEEKQQAAVNLIQSLQALYPCEKCRLHFNQKMGTSLPLVSSRKAFSSWVCMLHNLVNEDKGKEHFDCTLKHLDEVYLKDCDGCIVDGKVEDLSENAIEFGAPVESAAKQQPPASAGKVSVDVQADGESTSSALTALTTLRQKGDCSIESANKHHWLPADVERPTADLTDGMLTIVFFNSVTCHVCHEIHPVLRDLHDDFAHRGLNIISVHHTIYGDIDEKFESQAVDYHALEELQYPILSHQQTATQGDDDRVALPNSLFYMSMGRDGFGVPAMAVMKDCKTVWRGMGFQLKQINDWVRSNADKYLAPESA